jgi:hypothetical protein
MHAKIGERLCSWGMHHWSVHEASLRPGSLVARCERCGMVKVTHKLRRPSNEVKAREDAAEQDKSR